MQFASSKNYDDVVLCVSAVLSKSGRIVTIPNEKGILVQFFFSGGLFDTGDESKFHVSIEKGESIRLIMAQYRHPLSQKAAENLLKDLNKKCLLG